MPLLTLSPWKAISFPGIPPAMFARIGPSEFRIKTDGSAGILYRAFGSDFPSGTCATWEWRVDKATPATNLAIKGADDRSAAIHFWFPNRKSGWFNRFKHRLGRFVNGVPFDGKSLTYVWGGTGQVGETIVNPFLKDDGMIHMLRAPGYSATRHWQQEHINLAKDFAAAFGEEPTQPVIVALSADSDDTNTSSLSYVKNLKLSFDCD